MRVANLRFQDLTNEMAGLADLRQAKEAVHFLALLLRHDDARGTKRGQLDRDIRQGNAEFFLQPGNGIGLLAQQIQYAKTSRIRQSLADAHLHCIETLFATDRRGVSGRSAVL